MRGFCTVVAATAPVVGTSVLMTKPAATASPPKMVTVRPAKPAPLGAIEEAVAASEASEWVRQVLREKNI